MLTLIAGLTLGGASAAQVPAQPGPAVNPSNYLPNYFNPRTQPVSPYMNLLRGGGIPGVNYYYGVRPGTVGMMPGGIGGASTSAGGGNRMLFFPQLAAAPDPLSGAPPGAGDVLPPAGHPVVFNNTMGFFPSPLGQAGGARAGLAGLGARRR
jgi:hypothetical protein